MIEEIILDAKASGDNEGLEAGGKALPLWHPAALAELRKRDLLNSRTEETITNMALKLDSVVNFRKINDEDVFGNESDINYTGDKFENEAGEVKFHRFNSEKEEQEVEKEGWKRTEDSYLRNPALAALRVTGAKTMETIPTPFTSNSVGEGDIHLLFMNVSVSADDKLRIEPSPRMYDVMEFMQTAVLTTTHQYDDEVSLKKNLVNKGIEPTRRNVKDFRNLGYLNNVISDRRGQCCALLGVSRKEDLSFDDKQYYLKVGSSVSNFCMSYMHREGIINRLASDMVHNSYGKFKATYEADKNGTERAYKAPSDVAKELKRINEKYTRIDEALNGERSVFRGRGIALYEINSDVFEAMRENPGATKALFAHANRFTGGKSDHSRNIIYGKKTFERENFNVDKYHDNAWQKGEETIDIQNNMQNIAYEYDKAAYALIKAMIEKDPGIELKIKKQMGYIPEDSLEFKKASFLEKDSILARNKNYDTALSTYMQGYVDGQFRFPGFMMATGRYMLETRATGENASLNPQVDKFHRFLIQTSAQGKAVLDLENDEHVQSACKCIGFALGEPFDKKSTKQYIDEFNEMFKKKTGTDKDLISIDKETGKTRFDVDYIASDDFRKKTLPGFQRYILSGEVEEIGASLKNLAQLNRLSHKLKNDIEQGKGASKTYKVSFMAEIDGTTNGQAIRVMSMPLGVYDKEVEKDTDLRRKGGLLEKEHYTQIGDYREEGNADLYITLSRNFHKLSIEKSYVDKEWRKALVRFIGNDPDSKDSRNFFKKIGTVSGYGATRGMINTFDDVIKESYEKRQAERAFEIQEIMKKSTVSKLDKDVKKIEKLILDGEKDTVAFLRLRGMGGNSKINEGDIAAINEDCLGVGLAKSINKDESEGRFYAIIKGDWKQIKDNELSKVDHSTVESVLTEDILRNENCRRILKDCKGDVSKDILDSSFEKGKNEYVKTSEVLLPETMRETIPGLYDLNLNINKTVNLQNELMLDFKKDINEAIRQKGQKIYDFENDRFEKGISSILELTYEDAMKKIERETIGRVEFGDCTIPIGAAENQQTFDRHGQELGVTQHVRGIEKNGPIENERTIYEKSLSDPGASANVYSTHPLDAMIMRETLAHEEVNYSFNQVLDAAVVTQDQMVTVGRVYNENFLKAVVRENPAKNILDHFNKSMDYMVKVYDVYSIPKPEILKAWDTKTHEFDDRGIEEKTPLHVKITAHRNLKESVRVISGNKVKIYKDMSIYTCCQMSGSQPYEKQADYDRRKERLKAWHLSQEKERQAAEEKTKKPAAKSKAPKKAKKEID